MSHINVSGNDITSFQLFRAMCTTWIKVDRLYQEEADNFKTSEDATAWLVAGAVSV